MVGWLNSHTLLSRLQHSDASDPWDMICDPLGFLSDETVTEALLPDCDASIRATALTPRETNVTMANGAAAFVTSVTAPEGLGSC